MILGAPFLASLARVGEGREWLRAKFPVSRKRSKTWGTRSDQSTCQSIVDGQSRGGFIKAAPFLRSWGVGQLVPKFFVRRRLPLRANSGLAEPEADLVFNGETSGDGTGESGLERKGVRFERHGEMKFRIGEAAHEEVDVTIEAQHLELHSMDESVKQRALRDAIVEDDDVEEGQRIHVRDCGRLSKPRAFAFS